MTADFADLIKPPRTPLVLMDDRFTAHGDMVTAVLTGGEVLLHVATEGAGTADLLLDAEMACRIARALLDGARRVDPGEWRLTAAHRMLDDAYEADWQGDLDWSEEAW